MTPYSTAAQTARQRNIPSHSTHVVPEPLTRREREVLVLIAKGMRNKGIADALFISERTVKFHANALYAKLGVTGRTAAVGFALTHRMIAMDEMTA
jgi:two-component system, NarL family, sensor kinase